jgi:beta-xylosidase
VNKLQIVGQQYNTFHHLMKDLEPFVDTRDIKLSFDKDGNAYLVASDFTEQLQADPKLHRQVREEMRQIIAKHRSIHAE